jgi:hypothetical protein
MIRVEELPAPPVRASDADRNETVERLHRALGEGRLDLTETDERVAAAYAARHRGELLPLLADLPAPAPEFGRTGPPTWTDLWGCTVWRGRAVLLSAVERPTAKQCRIAAAFTALVLVWMTVCAVMGAAVVG